MDPQKQQALTPQLKAQQRKKFQAAKKAQDLSNEYREIKEHYPKVWKDLTGFISRRLEDHERSIDKRMGAQLDPDNPNKLRLVPLTNEQIVTLLDKKAELQVIDEFLKQKVAIKK